MCRIVEEFEKRGEAVGEARGEVRGEKNTIAIWRTFNAHKANGCSDQEAVKLTAEETANSKEKVLAVLIEANAVPS